MFASRRDRLVYEYDATPDAAEPLVAVFPRSSSQIPQVVRLAREAGIPVVARGAGTNLSGGTVPPPGGVVLALTRMDRVLGLELENERAMVEPGVVNLDLQRALSPHGYLFAPDPSSQKVSTLGGNVGENAAGPHCLKYGVTTNHVLGLELVLADGRVVATGGACEDSPGYDLTGLVNGSEGTLGVVASMILRLIRAPEAIKTVLAVFARLEDAGNEVSDIIADGIIPATLEIMDGDTVESLAACGVDAGYPAGAGAVLLIELDGLLQGLDRQAERIDGWCRQNGALELRIARSEEERDQLWLGRRAAYSALVGSSLGVGIHDLTVPRTRLAETLAGVVEIGRRQRIKIPCAAHAGDGNLHPVVLFDPRRGRRRVS